MDSEKLLEIVRNAYGLAERFSVTGLLIATLIFTVAFLYAFREAVSWFFKIDQIRGDIARLMLAVQDLEAELQVAKSLSGRAGVQDSAPVVPVQPEKKSRAFPIIQ